MPLRKTDDGHKEFLSVVMRLQSFCQDDIHSAISSIFQTIKCQGRQSEEFSSVQVTKEGDVECFCVAA